MACTATVRGRTAGYLLLCAVLLTAGDAVSMRAAEGRVSPNAASNGMSPQARAYLDHALGLLQEYSIAREHTDWADLRQWTYSSPRARRPPAAPIVPSTTRRGTSTSTANWWLRRW